MQPPSCSKGAPFSSVIVFSILVNSTTPNARTFIAKVSPGEGRPNGETQWCLKPLLLQL